MFETNQEYLNHIKEDFGVTHLCLLSNDERDKFALVWGIDYVSENLADFAKGRQAVKYRYNDVTSRGKFFRKHINNACFRFPVFRNNAEITEVEKWAEFENQVAQAFNKYFEYNEIPYIAKVVGHYHTEKRDILRTKNNKSDVIIYNHQNHIIAVIECKAVGGKFE